MKQRSTIVLSLLGWTLTILLSIGCDDQQSPGTSGDVGDTVEDMATGDATEDADAPILSDASDDVSDMSADVSDASADVIDVSGEDADVGASCIEAQPSSGSGGHRAGQDCISCHANQSASRRWTVAGTLFDAEDGTTPVVGATIVLVDDDGVERRLVTASNGNFYTTQSFAFPLTVRASKCPDDAPMIDAVENGSCNNCHTSGSRIHLP